MLLQDARHVCGVSPAHPLSVILVDGRRRTHPQLHGFKRQRVLEVRAIDS